MKLVIADTSPVNYLILIGQIELLHRLFERVVLPTPVQAELSSPIAPQQVQNWIINPPFWLEVMEAPALDSVTGLHKGEAAAIALAAVL